MKTILGKAEVEKAFMFPFRGKEDIIETAHDRLKEDTYEQLVQRTDY